MRLDNHTQEVNDVSGISQHLRQAAMLVVLIAIVGVGAASAMAAQGAASAAKPFELVFNGAYDFDVDGGIWLAGAFTSKAPFCESGSAVDLDLGVRRFVCADGSGSITLEAAPLGAIAGDWRIRDGTGQYADLRGRGTSWEEMLSDDPWFGEFRSTYQGVADADAMAPTIGLAVKASKVKGKKGVYTIQVELDIRDNAEDNPVAYTVSVRRERGTGPWLASKSGEAIGAVSFALRTRRPNEPVRALLVRTTAVDPVGNESTLDARVKLPQ
jgi:hypothetical protein